MTTTLAVLGASGDMARRLLFPALYELETDDRLDDLRIVGYALEAWDVATFRERVRQGLTELAGLTLAPATWQRFADRLSYHAGDLDAASLRQLTPHLDGNAAFYLALPPGMFSSAATALTRAGFNDSTKGWRRLVIEKPFGTDLRSASRLNQELHRTWSEEQIFRIDHYLGKETVQNIVVFRFGNRFLDPVLNASHVDHVQITAAETLGLEGRYRYYDQIGALRDMLQSHLIQLFALVTMEPPSVWDADILHDHKVEALRSVRPIAPRQVSRQAARGQYGSGSVEGAAVPGYREETGIRPGSTTETFAALKLYVDNWRWAGVPFYLRSGKRLGADLTEVAIQFRTSPLQSFAPDHGASVTKNRLVFRLRPSESINLHVLAREPGLEMKSQALTLHADYSRGSNEASASYRQLILDVIEGDRTPFLRFDEVEWAWRILDPVLRSWRRGQPQFYAAGSDGPAAQNALMDAGQSWRPLSVASEQAETASTK